MDYNSYKRIPLFEGYCRQNDVDDKEIECEIGEHKLRLKVASTPQSQARGYMHAEKGPNENEGIIFVYQTDEILRFWMKDVRFPLDIMYFNSNHEFVGYETMEPLGPDEIRIHKSPKPAQYAIETKAGWCKDNLKGENYKLKI